MNAPTEQTKNAGQSTASTTECGNASSHLNSHSHRDGDSRWPSTWTGWGFAAVGNVTCIRRSPLQLAELHIAAGAHGAPRQRSTSKSVADVPENHPGRTAIRVARNYLIPVQAPVEVGSSRDRPGDVTQSRAGLRQVELRDGSDLGCGERLGGPGEHVGDGPRLGSAHELRGEICDCHLVRK